MESGTWGSGESEAVSMRVLKTLPNTLSTQDRRPLCDFLLPNPFFCFLRTVFKREQLIGNCILLI